MRKIRSILMIYILVMSMLLPISIFMTISVSAAYTNETWGMTLTSNTALSDVTTGHLTTNGTIDINGYKLTIDENISSGGRLGDYLYEINNSQSTGEIDLSAGITLTFNDSIDAGLPTDYTTFRSLGTEANPNYVTSVSGGSPTNAWRLDCNAVYYHAYYTTFEGYITLGTAQSGRFYFGNVTFKDASIKLLEPKASTFYQFDNVTFDSSTLKYFYFRTFSIGGDFDGVFRNVTFLNNSKLTTVTTPYLEFYSPTFERDVDYVVAFGSSAKKLVIFDCNDTIGETHIWAQERHDWTPLSMSDAILDFDDYTENLIVEEGHLIVDEDLHVMNLTINDAYYDCGVNVTTGNDLYINGTYLNVFDNYMGRYTYTGYLIDDGGNIYTPPRLDYSRTGEIEISTTNLNSPIYKTFRERIVLRNDDVDWGDWNNSHDLDWLVNLTYQHDLKLSLEIISGRHVLNPDNVSWFTINVFNNPLVGATCHGWKGESITDYDYDGQVQYLQNCTDEWISAFGIGPNILIPSYHNMNDNTVLALEYLGWDAVSCDYNSIDLGNLTNLNRIMGINPTAHPTLPDLQAAFNTSWDDDLTGSGADIYVKNVTIVMIHYEEWTDTQDHKDLLEDFFLWINDTHINSDNFTKSGIWSTHDEYHRFITDKYNWSLTVSPGEVYTLDTNNFTYNQTVWWNRKGHWNVTDLGNDQSFLFEVKTDDFTDDYSFQIRKGTVYIVKPLFYSNFTGGKLGLSIREGFGLDFYGKSDDAFSFNYTQHVFSILSDNTNIDINNTTGLVSGYIYPDGIFYLNITVNESGITDNVNVTVEVVDDNFPYLSMITTFSPGGQPVARSKRFPTTQVPMEITNSKTVEITVLEYTSSSLRWTEYASDPTTTVIHRIGGYVPGSWKMIKKNGENWKILEVDSGGYLTFTYDEGYSNITFGIEGTRQPLHEQINDLIPVVIAMMGVIVVVSVIFNGLIRPLSKSFRRMPG